MSWQQRGGNNSVPSVFSPSVTSSPYPNGSCGVTRLLGLGVWDCTRQLMTPMMAPIASPLKVDGGAHRFPTTGKRRVRGQVDCGEGAV